MTSRILTSSRQQHHDPVDPRRATAMRGRAIAERADQPAESPRHLRLVIACEFEGADHDVEAMIPDRAREDLVAVAAEIVLIPQDFQGIAVERLHPALRHREGVVREIHLPRFLIGLVHGEIDDPGEGKAVRLGQVQFADDVAGLRRHPFECLRLAAQEEGRIPLAQAQLPANRLCTVLSDILGKRGRRPRVRSRRRARRYSPSPATPRSGRRRSSDRRNGVIPLPVRGSRGSACRPVPAAWRRWRNRSPGNARTHRPS